MMKYIFFIVTILAASGLAAGQNAKQNDALEQKISRLEQGQVDALLLNDLMEMEKHRAEDYTVNITENSSAASN